MIPRNRTSADERSLTTGSIEFTNVAYCPLLAFCLPSIARLHTLVKMGQMAKCVQRCFFLHAVAVAEEAMPSSKKRDLPVNDEPPGETYGARRNAVDILGTAETGRCNHAIGRAVLQRAHGHFACNFIASQIEMLDGSQAHP